MAEDEESVDRRKADRTWREDFIGKMATFSTNQEHLEDSLKTYAENSEKRTKEFSERCEQSIVRMEKAADKRFDRVEKTIYGDGNGERGMVAKLSSFKAASNMLNLKVIAMGAMVIFFSQIFGSWISKSFTITTQASAQAQPFKAKGNKP